MVTDPDLGVLYRLAREQVAGLVRSLSPQQLEAPIPVTPGWTVHGVVSHLAGVATDAVNGRLEGMPPPEQTAAQVAERAETPTSVVLREWERSGSQLEALLGKIREVTFSPVTDAAVHEQDIRGAVGVPGNRQGPLVDLALGVAADLWMSRIESAGLLPAGAGEQSGPSIVGSDDAPVKFVGSRFEFFRAIYGRRSRRQIERRFVGTDDPSAYVSLMCVFQPPEHDVIE